MRRVILNWLPPAMLELPSPAMSILKRHLEQNGFETEVLYWNIQLAELQCQFIWMDNPTWANREKTSLLLFFNYLAIKYEDKDSYVYVKANLMQLKPQAINTDADFFDKHMRAYAKRLDAFLEEKLAVVDLTGLVCIGFSVNLYQWIVATIIADKIKRIKTDISIVVGGIGRKEAAVEYLKNFSQFDFAIWGEGEESLLMLCNLLANKTSAVDDIPDIAYRRDTKIEVSTKVKENYSNLADVRSDFADYFKKENKDILAANKVQTHLPVEFSRGCHWNRCHFCYLNTGYRYRIKSTEALADEIKQMIREYGIFRYSIMDNDTVGVKSGRFNLVLEMLIQLRKEYPEFVINLAEIITKDISEEIVKKMSLAGFESVQIGYESPSNNLLKKIDKKNSFATNLLFIKLANKYGIRVAGVNVIQGLLEETNEDIMEGISNLHVLRYFF